MDTFTAKERSDRRKSAPLKTWRDLTFDEVKAIGTSHALFLTRQGDIAAVKITSVKTWKSRPNNLRLGIKYGLYEYGTIEYIDGKLSGGVRLVMEVVE